MTSLKGVNWSNLDAVKKVADDMAKEFGQQMTVILRPGHVSFNIIHTVNEPLRLKDATVVYRTADKKS